VLLISPRATLGQRKSLINSITPITKHQFSGKTTQTQYKIKQTQHTKEAALRPNGLGGGSISFRAPSRTLRIQRTRMPVGRTSPSTRLVETFERPRTFLPATATAASRDCAPAGSPAAPTTTASAQLRYRPTVPVPVRPANRSSDTPAVASDGDLDVSRRTLAPGLVRRADAATCVLRATANRKKALLLSSTSPFSQCADK